MSSEKGKGAENQQIGVVELVGICGFAFFFGWMLVSFYWLFSEYPPDVPTGTRDAAQLFVFAGIAVGYFALHLAAKSPKYNPYSPPMLAATAVLSVLLPVTALLLYSGIHVPLPVTATANFCAGLAGAKLTVSWLDASSLVRTQSYQRFVSLSLFGGGILFALVAFLPTMVQPVFCILYALASLFLHRFIGTHHEEREDAPDIQAVTKSPWVFTREIEPSLVAFGIVFGLTFVYLFNSGAQAVLAGLAFVLPGAGVIAVLSHFGKSVGITAIQRVLLCVTVLACLLVPFATDIVQIGCSCLVVASWAAFMSVNYAHLVQKSTDLWDAPVFRQIPVRLVFSALGFLTGWGIATAITLLYGAHSDVFMIVRLCMAFLLVAIVMLFFPVSKHHLEGADEDPDEPAAPAVAVVPNMTEKELFERRCNAVASLYQLSPREIDILKFLAKGRNAAYIQNKLTISPHTVKSHIYSIYRKLDIHSQQKLMDFVEEFPVDVSDAPPAAPAGKKPGA